ncbi:MAG: D-glycero-beta-D-manno-heptose 1-phosphate adenylyltransferase [Pseudomonadota bacterium]
MARQALKSLILDASRQSVLCIGDAMLDTFVYGDVERISPEAPVPIMRESRRAKMPGGAANTARNLAALGANVRLVAATGNDEAGDALLELLNSSKRIEPFLVQSSGFATVCKTRFVSSGQQLLRVDQEPVLDLGQATEADLVRALQQADDGVGAIVLSDYAKGTLTAGLIEAALDIAAQKSIPVIVDPKGHDLARYGRVALIKPNASELASITNLPTSTDEEVEAALAKALDLCTADVIMVTRAAKGLSFVERADPRVRHMRGEARDVYDVSGAGDTSLAALGIGLSAGVPIHLAAEFALLASGLAVTKAGTATVSATELLDLGSAEPIPLETVLDLVERWRADGYRIGFTNGCFDLLHPGHLKVLEEAKVRCDRLIVGLNSDGSVKRLKGEGRPVNSESARARVLSGLSAVDGVVLFEEDTPLELIQAIKPDLLVKGGDYSIDTIVGAEFVLNGGGEVHIVPLLDGHSTTELIARSADQSSSD